MIDRSPNHGIRTGALALLAGAWLLVACDAGPAGDSEPVTLESREPASAPVPRDAQAVEAAPASVEGDGTETGDATDRESLEAGPDGTRAEAAPGSAPTPAAARPSESVEGSRPAGPTGSTQDPTPAPSDSILRATARAYEGVHALRAEFVQELENPLLGRTTRSEGTIYQRHPDRFLMDFSDPEGDVIVSDGDWFWMWFPSVDTTQVLRTARAGGLDLKSEFIGDPARRFEATYHGVESVRGRDAHVLTLIPRESAGYRSLKVWIDDSDHLVRRFELEESSGNVRHFELRDLQVNPSLPDGLFEFTPPPGVRVVTR